MQDNTAITYYPCQKRPGLQNGSVPQSTTEWGYNHQRNRLKSRNASVCAKHWTIAQVRGMRGAEPPSIRRPRYENVPEQGRSAAFLIRCQSGNATVSTTNSCAGTQSCWLSMVRRPLSGCHSLRNPQNIRSSKCCPCCAEQANLRKPDSSHGNETVQIGRDSFHVRRAPLQRGWLSTSYLA